MFQYLIATNEGDLTVGIEDQSGSDGLEIAHNNGSYLENNLAVLIKTVVDWVQVSPSNGSVEQLGTDLINIAVEAADLEIGEYLCDLIISTNDPNASSVVIPIELTVGEIVLYPPANLNISVSGGLILLGWVAVVTADSYNVYGSSLSDLPFESWDLLQSGIILTNWSTLIGSDINFFKVVAIKN